MEFGICPVNLLEFKDLQQREPEISVYQNRQKSALKLLESKNVKERILNQILNSLIQNTSIHKEFHVYWPLQQNNEKNCKLKKPYIEISCCKEPIVLGIWPVKPQPIRLLVCISKDQMLITKILTTLSDSLKPISISLQGL